jgi:hypothetical protein
VWNYSVRNYGKKLGRRRNGFTIDMCLKSETGYCNLNIL